MGRESGARNLEAESIRSRAESTGGCVKLKTVTEIRRSILPGRVPEISYRCVHSLITKAPALWRNFNF